MTQASLALWLFVAKAIIPYIADDFDEPLPEDFLLRPLPVDR